MTTFELYLDKKVEGWERNTYQIKANTLEEAKQKLIDIYTQSREFEEEFMESTFIYETFSDAILGSPDELSLELLDSDLKPYYNNISGKIDY